MLIVYYSWSNGNTKGIAKKLGEATVADLVKINTVIPYTGSYDEVVNQGQDEVNRGYQPEIEPLSVNIKDYDVIAVGTPAWWYTMAPAVLTFLNGSEWKDKLVIPFITHGGWPGHAIRDIKNVCIGASFPCEMEIQFDSTGGDQLKTTQNEIDAWIKTVKNSL